MPDNVVEVHFVATDEISSTVSRMSATVDRNMSSIKNTSQALDELSDHQENARKHADALDRQWNKLTSGTEIMASGVMHFRRVLEGILWGSAIGAASALVTQLTSLAIAAFDTSEKIDRIAKSIQDADNAMANAGKRYTLEVRARMQELSTIMASIEEQLSRGIFVPPENIAKIREEFAMLRRELDTLEKDIRFITPMGLAQEALGKFIQDQAKIQIRGRALTQETLGRMIQEQAKREIEIKSATQEQLGLMIQQAAKREYDIRVGTQEQMGRDIANAARLEWEEKERIATQHTQRINAIRMAEVQFAISVADALFVASGGKSKALFLLTKGLMVAQAFMSAFTAANMALAHPPGPPTTIPIAASVLHMGLMNAAAVAATQIGSAVAAFHSGGQFGGGGAVGGVGAPGIPVTSPESVQNQGRPINVNITIEGHVLDQSTMDRLANDVLPSLGQIIQDRAGQAGPIQITYNRP